MKYSNDIQDVYKNIEDYNPRKGQKSIVLSNLSIYYTCKKMKSSYNNNKFKISAPTWSYKFELLDG